MLKFILLYNLSEGTRTDLSHNMAKPIESTKKYHCVRLTGLFHTQIYITKFFC